ncbi:hypothetical protein GCM10007148_26460 [Parvularcula lutaonensis]|nr:hypothetical protein GCM10007148_26460 [Parvularcula lutaonensis]
MPESMDLTEGPSLDVAAFMEGSGKFAKLPRPAFRIGPKKKTPPAGPTGFDATWCADAAGA